MSGVSYIPVPPERVNEAKEIFREMPRDAARLAALTFTLYPKRIRASDGELGILWGYTP
jgi:hypothetical protein